MAEPVAAPFTAYLGGVMKEFNEGRVELSVITREEHADITGRVHTGVLTSLMDSAIGIALGRLRGERARELEGPHATIEMSTTFYTWAQPGDELRIEGRITALTRRIAFGESEARRAGDGELLAKARLTFAIPARRS